MTVIGLDQTQLHDSMRNKILTDIQRERILTAFRKSFLEGRSRENIPFMVSLACQCFNNEYIYPVSEEEQRAVLRLKESLSSVRDLIVYAMYEPLWTVRDAVFRLGLDGDPDTKELFKRQVCEPEEEEQIKKSIRSFGVSDDPISKAVRGQYEESPYPRWVNIELPERTTFRDAMISRFPSMTSIEVGSPVQILVAGCGTGHHPIGVAAKYSDAQITAIDFSKASLAYAIRQARRYEFPNLTFLHGDILNLEPHQEFDHIEAVGVLHHMSDPAAGLRALTRVLKPRGFMKLGLYSRRALSFAQDAKRIASELNLGTSPAALRELRQEIMRRLPGFTFMSDLYCMSHLRDLLCHAHEVQFYPTELRPLLDAAGLTLLGYRGINSVARAEYVAAFPQDPYMRDLDLVDAFESDHPDFLGSGLQVIWVQAQ